MTNAKELETKREQMERVVQASKSGKMFRVAFLDSPKEHFYTGLITREDSLGREGFYAYPQQIPLESVADIREGSCLDDRIILLDKKYFRQKRECE